MKTHMTGREKIKKKWELIPVGLLLQELLLNPGGRGGQGDQPYQVDPGGRLYPGQVTEQQ